MTTSLQMPQVGETFAVRGDQKLVYMGETVEIRHIDSNELQRTAPMTPAMREQLPSQYNKYLASHRRCSATL